MDDPWGSPWAADDTQLKLDLPVPPPQVHAPQTPHKTASPWAASDEDDTWGGWNAAEGGHSADSPGWGRSPALRPARSNTISRHVSPEPWGRLRTLDSRSDATEERRSEKDVPVPVDSAISLGEEDPFAPKPQGEKEDALPQSVVPISFNEVELKTAHEVHGAEDVSAKQEEGPSEWPESPTGEPSRASTAPDRSEVTRQTSKVQELVHMYDGIAKRKNLPGESLVAGPRIVLVGSDGVQDQDQDQDQDQEDEARAKLAEDGAYPSAQEGTSDYNDFEGNDRTDDASDDVFNDVVSTIEATESSQLDKPEEPGSPVEIETHGEQPPEQPLSTDAKVPSIPYSYDLKWLDELFPSTPVPTIDPEPVPDVIIDDTFASISERKAWYRVSRRGPMRQHNQGNDEDYVRLDWRSSGVRGRTLKIVRRWMEEDSIAGRVVLGRRTGPVGASMFNWDSQAPQVEIGELLGKNSHRRSISGVSKGSKGSLPSPSSATFAWSARPEGPSSNVKPSLEEPKRNSWIAPPQSIMSPVTPDFGWSSAPQNSTGLGDKPASSDVALDTRKDPTSLAALPSKTPQSLDSITTTGLTSASLRGQPIPEAENDDDDEWGEMVSSPTWPPNVTASQTGQLGDLAPDPTDKVQDAPSTARSQTSSPGSEPHATSTPLQSRPSEPRPTTTDLWKEADHEQRTPAADQAVLDPWSVSEPLKKADGFLSGVSLELSKAATTSAEKAPESTVIPPSTNLTAEEQAFVQRTLNDLPDLSYMLR
ncbi:hypothetical protein NLU13_9436 [Sarocladium strictum]|uniref:Uncharacterized protein n=1 Tax=Sarocladium strictum TaxID=5046 RepID=A0AA39L4D1_SARSR|nr:hypothetical protein NLU13_9436 [Sarocladium strictum]